MADKARVLMTVLAVVGLAAAAYGISRLPERPLVVGGIAFVKKAVTVQSHNIRSIDGSGSASDKDIDTSCVLYESALIRVDGISGDTVRLIIGAKPNPRIRCPANSYVWIPKTSLRSPMFAY